MQPANRKVIKLNHDQNFKGWFEEIYNEYFERLYRYAFSITKSKELSEDAVEEVFLKIWERNNHDGIKDIKNYLYASIRHVAIRLASKDPARFSNNNYEEINQVAESLSPEDLLLTAELKNLLTNTITRLPPHCRLIYEMIKNQGKSYEETAVAMGVTTKTIENQMSKALNQIRAQLENYFRNSGATITWIYRLKIIAFLFLSFC